MLSVHKVDCNKLVDNLPVIQTIFSSKEEAIEYCKKCQEIDNACIKRTKNN